MPLSGKDCQELRSALAGRATNFRYSDVARWLRRAGFEEPRSEGSHRTWVHSSTGIRVVLVERGRGELLPVYVKRAVAAMLTIGECRDDPQP
jgi:predicted RNA binding protein YcfA (HicA-like mRNA interferase family)